MFKLPEWKYLKYQLQEKWAQITARKGYSSSSYKGDSFLRRLSDFRIFAQTNPIIKYGITGVCGLLIVIGIWASFFSGGGKTQKIIDSDQAWFYDLNTGKLFKSDKTDFPPIETASGPLPDGKPAGVIANVYTYDPTGKDKSQQFVGYLETLTEKGRGDWMAAYQEDRHEQMNWQTGRLVKRPEDKQWFKADSPMGKFIITQADKPNDKGQNAYNVLP